MIKIQDDQGKLLYTVKDDATEPERVASGHYSCPKCHTDWEHGREDCPKCDKKEGEQ